MATVGLLGTVETLGDWGRSASRVTQNPEAVFISIPNSNYHTIALFSHPSKILLKILQARLPQYMNWELSDGENVERVSGFIFLGSKINDDCSHKIKRHLLLGRKEMRNLDSILKSRDITLSTNVWRVKAMVFPVWFFHTFHVWMWDLNHKEGWVPKNWCFQTAVLEKTLESPLDSKGDQTSQS